MNRTLLFTLFVMAGMSIFAADVELAALTGIGDEASLRISYLAQSDLGVLTDRFFNLGIEVTPSGDIHLFWNADPEAASYRVFWSGDSQVPGSPCWVELAELQTTSYTDQRGLDAGLYYVCTATRVVPGGTFFNGVSNVTLSSFTIDRFETTQSSYLDVMGVNPAWFVGNLNHPVEAVSWFNAIEYCNRRSLQEGLAPCYSLLDYGTNPDNWPAGWNATNSNHYNVYCAWTNTGYRLPTEMEWMFAARGGNLSQGYNYSGSNDIGAVAWYELNNTPYGTKPVGLKAPNELGLKDLSGNVWEWCWDIFGPYFDGPQTDPHGTATGNYRIYRGGAWDDPAENCTVSTRNYYLPNYAESDHIGFRTARTQP